MNHRANHHKATWTGRLNTNVDGRSGVFNYAGHFSTHAGYVSLGVHLALEREPDRPVVLHIQNDDHLDALHALVTAAIAARDAAKGDRL